MSEELKDPIPLNISGDPRDAQDVSDIFEELCKDLGLELDKIRKKFQIKAGKKPAMTHLMRLCDMQDLELDIRFNESKVTVYYKVPGDSVVVPEEESKELKAEKPEEAKQALGELTEDNILPTQNEEEETAVDNGPEPPKEEEEEELPF